MDLPVFLHAQERKVERAVASLLQVFDAAKSREDANLLREALLPYCWTVSERITFAFFLQRGVGENEAACHALLSSHDRLGN